MVGDFNIKKFLTENKVTVASQRLAEIEMPTIYDKDGKEMVPASSGSFGYGSKMNELDVQDSQVTDSIKEFYELQQEMNTMKSRLKEMEARFKGFEGVIKPMLDEMKELGDKLAMAGEFVIKVTKFGGERMDASYKDAFENALSKVNAATKNVLQEALEASKKVTQVKHSIDIQPANQLQEGIMDRITGAFKGFLSRLDKKVDIAAKAVEDFINAVADNVPGGEDVDDTPNPVLEKLSGNQDKLDKNKDGKISGEDFKMMKKEAINPAQQAAIAISKKENVKEELGMRTKEVPNEHAGKYFVKGTKTGENVKSGFNTQDEALKWARENMRQAEYSVHKHKDTKRVYTVEEDVVGAQAKKYTPVHSKKDNEPSKKVKNWGSTVKDTKAKYSKGPSNLFPQNKSNDEDEENTGYNDKDY